MLKAIATALVIAVLGTSFTASAGEAITYTIGGITFDGYIARPTGSTGKRPGVIVVHEWWGNNTYSRRRADMLAELGYVALALDMYGDGKVADHPSDAGKFAGEVRKNMDVGEQRFRAALELLQGQADVDKDRIAAIGYCFGGGVVLEMARRGLPLAGVVSFHGSLGGLSPIMAGKKKVEALVLNGAADPFIKPEQIAQYQNDMKAAGAKYTFINYPGVVHSFTNPDATAAGEKFKLPLRYNAQADANSWAEMQTFFNRTL